MHPCCGGSLQTGTKIIAIVNMVLSVIFILIGVFAIVGAAVTVFAPEKLSQEIDDNSEVYGTTTFDKDEVKAIGVSVLAVSIVVTVMFVISLLISLLLLIGANKRNRTFCMVWFVLCAIGLVFGILGLFMGLSQGPAYMTVCRIGGILLSAYYMWVVWAFMAEIKEGPGVVVIPYANSKA